MAKNWILDLFQTFGPKCRTFRVIQSIPSSYIISMTPSSKFSETRISNDFWENGQKLNFGTILDFWTSISDISSNSRHSIFIHIINDPKLHILKQESQNCLNGFWENGQKLNFGPILDFWTSISDLSNNSRHSIFIHNINDPKLHILKRKFQNCLNGFSEYGQKLKLWPISDFWTEISDLLSDSKTPSSRTTWRTTRGIFWDKNLKTVWTVFEKMAAKVEKRLFFNENGRHFEKKPKFQKSGKKTPPWNIF